MQNVDYLVFDTTNAFTYTSQALKLMVILDEYAKDGWDVPQVAFYTNSSSGSTMNRIYNEIYKAHRNILTFGSAGKASR